MIGIQVLKGTEYTFRRWRRYLAVQLEWRGARREWRFGWWRGWAAGRNILNGTTNNH